ncbi:hypothetical protein RJ639_043943 [Escallonia herrerae]|uniref:Protein LHY n=1 Tax=Escallonia herrerae TaxID=1293975 RepID=A0AA89B1Z6_9ASTE|nr:hypothetical protein RJ639_043943 [Escallonia herrerae]
MARTVLQKTDYKDLNPLAASALCWSRNMSKRKLEKEALVKGVAVRQAIDIEIPPPRPKRKPSNPYPRKIGAGTPPSQVGSKDGKPFTSVSSLPVGKSILDLEKEPPSELLDHQKPGVGEKLENTERNQDEDNSEVLFLSPEAPCASLSSENRNSMPPATPNNSCTFRSFAPISKEAAHKDETNESYVTFEAQKNRLDKPDAKQTFQDNGSCSSSQLGKSHLSHEPLIGKLQLTESFGGLSENDMQAAQSYPRHVPVHVIDGNLGMSTRNVCPDMSCQESSLHQMESNHGHTKLFANLPASSTTELCNNELKSAVHQSFPTFHPLFTPISSNKDDYQQFSHTSSPFSSLVVSALLQNPAAHAAASLAATFWPTASVDASANSPTDGIADFSSRQMNSAPSMAAIAAATVAAATAWWAARGLLPLGAPTCTGFTCSPTLASATPTPTPTDNGQDRAAINRRRENSPLDTGLQDQQLDPKYSEAMREQQSASKLPSLSLSDSEESEDRKQNNGLTAAAPEEAASAAELHDLNKTESRKQVDRSSCGSNTPSSSEVETDALDNNEKLEEESKEPDASQLASDPSNHRGRISSNSNDSWKEVSEGGRLAFQALFSRHRLPQSFSPPPDLNKGQKQDSIEKNNRDKENENALQLDLNGKTWGAGSSYQLVEHNTFFRVENSGGGGLLKMGLGHAKLKAHRTGFKPYKRCSVEANARIGSSNQEEERGSKRMRLEGDASV